MDLRGLGSSGPSALICWGRYGSYMPVAGFVLRTSSRLAVDAGRLSVRAIPRTLMPAFRQSAMLMRSSWLRYLELIFWGMSTVERYQSTDGFSFLPFDRVLPLRHTLPVRLDTPTARAACVKFMPASRCSTYRRRRAAHISPRVAYSTPSNTHLSTWPSHQSARRCDDHWNPPFIAYGHGVSGRLMIRYMMLVVMNGVAVLSLSLLAGNVLLGLSIYFLVPILIEPFIVYLVPAVSDLFYSSAIRSLADGALPLQNSLVSLVWLLVFLLAGYLSIVVRILEW